MIQTPLWANKGGQAVLPYNLYFVQFEENEGLEAKFQKITPVDILFIFNFHEIVSLLKKAQGLGFAYLFRQIKQKSCS